MRRYTRPSNGFSRKLENHAAATALNYFAYNFIKIHRTLRMSPAMAAGVETRLWSVEDLVALWEAYEQRRAEQSGVNATSDNNRLVGPLSEIRDWEEGRSSPQRLPTGFNLYLL